MDAKLFTTADAACEECGYEFKISNENVRKRSVNIVSENAKLAGKFVWLTSYDCPKCGNTHVCQIDDDATNKLLAKCKKDLRKAAKTKSMGGVLSDTKIANMQKTRNDLTLLRRKLAKELDGKFYVDDKQIKKIKFVHQNKENVDE